MTSGYHYPAVVPAQAVTHIPEASVGARWVPACAGTTGLNDARAFDQHDQRGHFRIRRGAPDRTLFQAAGQTSRRPRAHRRCRRHHPAGGLRSRAQDRWHRRRRAFLRRRSARHGCPQGPAGEPVRPRGQGRKAARVPAHPGVAERDRRRMACAVRARARRGRADASVARCWAATPTARRGRSRFRSPSWGRCRRARWCAARAPRPATAWW